MSPCWYRHPVPRHGPKLAPLTHRNVCHGAMNNIVQLGLGPRDRCLCITGLFYTQGILVSVLSSPTAGGSAVCTPGYDPAQFFEWLDEFRPTWYAAPVSMHRSILARRAIFRHRLPVAVASDPLYVLSCQSGFYCQVLLPSKMEELFRAPVLNSYGLSETSSTIAGERLPPAARKAGSVGVAVGCEIATIDEHGSILEPDQEGEIIVRGANVLSAYEGAPEVNRKSFVDGWLQHRRSRQNRPAWICFSDRPDQGDHQSRWGENLSGGNRRGLGRASSGGGGDHICAAG
jgi:oxalate---CoA ligase